MLVALPISAEEENYAPVGSPIENLDDLKGMQEGGSYYLIDNITLDGTWTPIVGDNITLDGKDSTGAVHTVTFAGGAYSLFGECTNLTVKNINFDGTIVFDNESIAYLSPVSCGNLKGSTTLTDIVSDVDITVNRMIGYNDGNHNKGQTVAGVVAYISGHPVGGVASTITLRNLSFTGSLHAKCRLQTMGGVLGRVLSARNDGGNATIENCTNYGALSVTPRHEKVDSSTNADTGVTSYWDVYSAVDAMGGVAGVIATSESTVIGCKNVAPITFNTISGDALGDYTSGSSRGGDFTFLGGIAGNVWGDNVVIEDCHNLPEGDFLYGRTSSTDGYAGGLIGRFANIFGEARIENCTNHGDLNCAWMAGKTAGLVAVVSNISNGGTMKGCINYGKVAAGEMRGGMGGVIADIIHETETDQKNPNYGKYYNCNFTVERCENYGNVTYDSTTGLGNSQNCALGGIVGKVEFKGDTFDQYTVDQKAVIDKAYVIACYNKGDVKNNNPTNGVIAVEAHHVGGIVGKAIALAHLEIRHCINAGNISIYDTNERGNGWTDVGGILGGIMTINGTWSWSQVDNGDFYIYDCHNFGNLKGGYTGGIFGATYQIYHDIRINIEGCTNHGTVTTAYRTYTNSSGVETNEGSYAGGIVASLDIADRSYGSLYIKNCLNTGSVTGSTVGGILGVRLETGGTRPGITQIINCSNTGKIHSIYPSHVAAGIVGAGHGTALTIRSCSNSGDVTNASATGVALPIGPDYSNATTGDGYTV